MSARTKLNVAYFNGCLFVAVLLGLAAGSWAVFLIALAGTLGSAIYSNEIRPCARKR